MTAALSPTETRSAPPTFGSGRRPSPAPVLRLSGVGKPYTTHDAVEVIRPVDFAVAAAVRIARRPEHRGQTIATVLPDSGERYLSSTLFEGVFDAQGGAL